jgi:hypothetical protein
MCLFCIVSKSNQVCQKHFNEASFCREHGKNIERAVEQLLPKDFAKLSTWMKNTNPARSAAGMGIPQTAARIGLMFTWPVRILLKLLPARNNSTSPGHELAR